MNYVVFLEDSLEMDRMLADGQSTRRDAAAAAVQALAGDPAWQEAGRRVIIAFGESMYKPIACEGKDDTNEFIQKFYKKSKTDCPAGDVWQSLEMFLSKYSSQSLTHMLVITSGKDTGTGSGELLTARFEHFPQLCIRILDMGNTMELHDSSVFLSAEKIKSRDQCVTQAMNLFVKHQGQPYMLTAVSSSGMPSAAIVPLDNKYHRKNLLSFLTRTVQRSAVNLSSLSGIDFSPVPVVLVPGGVQNNKTDNHIQKKLTQSDINKMAKELLLYLEGVCLAFSHQDIESSDKRTPIPSLYDGLLPFAEPARAQACKQSAFVCENLAALIDNNPIPHEVADIPLMGIGGDLPAASRVLLQRIADIFEFAGNKIRIEDWSVNRKYLSEPAVWLEWPERKRGEYQYAIWNRIINLFSTDIGEEDTWFMQQSINKYNGVWPVSFSFHAVFFPLAVKLFWIIVEQGRLIADPLSAAAQDLASFGYYERPGYSSDHTELFPVCTGRIVLFPDRVRHTAELYVSPVSKEMQVDFERKLFTMTILRLQAEALILESNAFVTAADNSFHPLCLHCNDPEKQAVSGLSWWCAYFFLCTEQGAAAVMEMFIHAGGEAAEWRKVIHDIAGFFMEYGFRGIKGLFSLCSQAPAAAYNALYEPHKFDALERKDAV